jgi:hypothetical protein
MPTLTFYVGERPVDPVIWDTGRDLTGLTPSLVGDALPAATVVVHDAAAGQVAISFTAPFTQVGVFTVQVRLARGTGEADLTDTVQFRVLDPAQTGAFTVINPGSVEGITGQSVSGPNVLQAQSLISLLVDRDLTDATVLAAINARDTALLRQAIAWQAASANGSATRFVRTCRVRASDRSSARKALAPRRPSHFSAILVISVTICECRTSPMIQSTTWPGV